MNPSTELIIFTTESGISTGETGPKLESHHASTRVHLAFSIFLFNTAGQFLVTQRAHDKKVWPDVWTGSCCGHPMPGETLEEAITRRLDYELGTTAKDVVNIVPAYRYTTPPYRGIIENEFCPIFVGRVATDIYPNPAEVADCRWVIWNEFLAAAADDSNDYSHPDEPGAPSWSYWTKDQLRLITTNPALISYTTPQPGPR